MRTRNWLAVILLLAICSSSWVPILLADMYLRHAAKLLCGEGATNCTLFMVTAPGRSISFYSYRNGKLTRVLEESK
jgi:hypothetical protein